MDKKDLERIRANNETLLKPIWDYLGKPHSLTITENGLNGGIRLVDMRRHASVHMNLMQAVHSGHIYRAGNFTLNTEHHIYHIPGVHGSASVAAEILKMEFEGRILDAQDVRRKTLFIEQPLPPFSEEAFIRNAPVPYEKAPSKPFFLKPSINSLLKAGEPVPEIGQLLAGEIAMLRPILSASDIKIPKELAEAAYKGKISVASILVQNHIDVFSTAARQKEASELVKIVTGRLTIDAQANADRLREILHLDM